MNKTLAGVIIALLVVVVALQSYSLLRGKENIPSTTTPIQTTSPENKPTTSPSPATSHRETYRDSSNLFQLTYDSSVFTKEIKDGYIAIPGKQGQQKVSQTTFVRYASFPTYGASGLKIGERTANPRISVSIIPSDYSTYEAYVYETFSKETIEPITLGGRKGIRYWIGAEGKGTATYCASASQTKTLCMQYNTIDGNVMTSYRTVSDFISFSEQRALAESLMDTVQFIN